MHYGQLENTEWCEIVIQHFHVVYHEISNLSKARVYTEKMQVIMTRVGYSMVYHSKALHN